MTLAYALKEHISSRETQNRLGILIRSENIEVIPKDAELEYLLHHMTDTGEDPSVLNVAETKYRVELWLPEMKARKKSLELIQVEVLLFLSAYDLTDVDPPLFEFTVDPETISILISLQLKERLTAKKSEEAKHYFVYEGSKWVL